jgi:hypothetical protein
MKNLIVNLLDILPDCMHAELLAGMQKIDEIDSFLESSNQFAEKLNLNTNSTQFVQEEKDELFDYFLKKIEG